MKVTLKGRIVKESGIEEGFMTIENGKIIEIGNKPDGNVIDFGNSYIMPGFIDLHIHGIHYSLVDKGPKELAEICRILPQYGVTGFLPTVAPRPKGEDADFLTSLSAAKTEGAAIFGFHLEGPFLKLTGALPAEAISAAETVRVQSLIDAAKPYQAIFSISPDVNGIENLLPLMSQNNTAVFITHTAANVRQTQEAIRLGANHATHFYDVFPCPEIEDAGVRPCGAVEAILADKNVSVDFILDGVHVNPVAVKMALACKSAGPGSVCLITDANVGAGLEPGVFTFGDYEIEFAYKGAPARSRKEKWLAGSGLTMDHALKNAMKWLDIELHEAVRLASTNPAKVVGMGNKKGKLLNGFDADFTIMDDQLNVKQTWVGGECRYRADK